MGTTASRTPKATVEVAIGMGYHYRARYEFILFFEKGKRKLNNLGVPDILTAKRVYRGYPTEKPVSVAETLVLQSTQPGELVIDPFMGSGSTGAAAIGAGRRFAGTDTCEEARNVTRARLVDAGGIEVEVNVAPDAAEAQAQLTLLK